MKDPVLSFYEKFPYPQPVERLEDWVFDRSRPIDGDVKEYFHVYWPARAADLKLDILFAGCGTTEAVKFAVNCPEARIIAIDISKESLAYSTSLAEKHNVKNITHLKYRIEDVAELDKKFDLIVCSGVLDHLSDPIYGLKCLNSVLKKDGSMYVMVRAKYGRYGISLLQDTFKYLGLDAAKLLDQDFNEVSQLVDKVPQGHPLWGIGSRVAKDLNERSGMADLFLNPRDRSYTVSNIYDMLESAGMKMQQWFYRYYYSPYCFRGLSQSAFFEQIKKMKTRDQYALGELYRGSILMHRFVCCSKERAAETYETSLDAADWKNLIPIKNRFLMLDTENKEPSKSGWILLPHYLDYGDKLNFDLPQSMFFDAIDGQKTIGQIQADMTVSNSPEEFDTFTKNFLKSLYEYDLVWLRK